MSSREENIQNGEGQQGCQRGQLMVSLSLTLLVFLLLFPLPFPLLLRSPRFSRKYGFQARFRSPFCAAISRRVTPRACSFSAGAEGNLKRLQTLAGRMHTDLFPVCAVILKKIRQSKQCSLLNASQKN